MTQLTEESLDWIWDDEKQKPHVRHWPAITSGAVHIHDVTDLHELRQAAREAQDVDDWADRYQRIMTPERYEVAVDTLADMLDHNRADCLGDATNLKGYSESLFALERGEVLDELPFPARLALLSDGLASIETVVTEASEVRAALESLTVADLQLVARQSSHIPQRLRKAELIDALMEAWERGEVEIPLGPISPAPPLHGWLKDRINTYVQALHTALGDPVYPLAFREAVWHKAIQESSIPALKKAIELEYWDVLETELDDYESTDDTTANTTGTDKGAAPDRDWQPGMTDSGQYRSIAWIAVGILVLLWLLY